MSDARWPDFLGTVWATMSNHHRGTSLDLGDVPAAYDRAAATYDKMVNLSPGYHRHLQSAADALVELLPAGSGLTVLDLGCGSGLSTDALVNSMGHRGEPFAAIGLDASVGMLAEAQSKSWPTWVSFVEGRAESLPALVSPGWRPPVAGAGGAGDSPRVAGVFAAHLFHDIADRDALLRSIWRLLEPGGVLVVQDCCPAGSTRARMTWNAVSWSASIPLAKAIVRDTVLYRQLWRSVLDNDSVDVFAARMLAAGFVDVEHRTVLGWPRGIRYTFRARKPS